MLTYDAWKVRQDIKMLLDLHGKYSPWDKTPQKEVAVFDVRKFFMKTVKEDDRIDDVLIHPHWYNQGYQWSMKFSKAQTDDMLNWCATNASGKFIMNREGRAVLFQDEESAIACKLTFMDDL